jgi:serine/threonine-protein kinase
MGEVYAGRQLQLDREVAIKVLRVDLSEEDSFVARFSREARTAAKLVHPNAVSVFDFGSLDGGGAYLVMEYIEGITLRESLRDRGRFPAAEALDLVLQAASAVAAAHARGIIHRDLKPDNLMLRADETGRVVVKVVDFGLAKVMESASQLTNQGDLLGTPLYMAPEQFTSENVDERADVYALGCVLFELLAGRPPFKGALMELAVKHATQEVPRLASFGVDVPPAVELAVRRALAKDPSERTASAAQFIRDLEGARSYDAAAATLPPRASAETSPVAGAAPQSGETRVGGSARSGPANTRPYATVARASEPVRPPVARPPAVDGVPTPATRRSPAAFPSPGSGAVRPSPARTAAVVAAAVAALVVVAAFLYWATHPASAPAGGAATPTPQSAAAPPDATRPVATDVSQPVTSSTASPASPTPSAAPSSQPSAPAPSAAQQPTGSAPASATPPETPPATDGGSDSNGVPTMEGSNPAPRPEPRDDPRDDPRADPPDRRGPPPPPPRGGRPPDGRPWPPPPPPGDRPPPPGR